MPARTANDSPLVVESAVGNTICLTPPHPFGRLTDALLFNGKDGTAKKGPNVLIRPVEDRLHTLDVWPALVGVVARLQCSCMWNGVQMVMYALCRSARPALTSMRVRPPCPNEHCLDCPLFLPARLHLLVGTTATVAQHFLPFAVEIPLQSLLHTTAQSCNLEIVPLDRVGDKVIHLLKR